MALAGSKNYTDTFTASDIIKRALARLGVLDPVETIDSTEQTEALVALNLLVKELSAYGIDNWLRQSGVVWISDPGVKSIYSLGPSGDPAAYDWYETELSADAASSATSITISAKDTTHTIDTANIGVRIDDGSIHWTTISGTPTTTVTLSTGLDGAASSGNKVYIYNTTSQLNRPKGLIYASRITEDTTNTSAANEAVDGIEAPINIIGRIEYNALSQKKQKGPPVSVHYEQTMTNGTLYVWPTGTTGKDYDKINLVTNIYPDDFDATTNNAQFPPEWLNSLVWLLASELAPEYGLPLSEQNALAARANAKLSALLDFDVENASVRFEPVRY